MLQCPRCGRQYTNDVLVCPNDHMPLQADVTIADMPVDPLLGRVFEGKYRLDERLGGGGMGTVYRATHLLIDRPVALKVLSQRFVGDQTAQQRFRREARAAGRMQHPNAVTVTDFGATEDGYLYIVMELLEGRTLRELLARDGPLDPARAVSIMLQTCSAVGAAHEAGLIHRDLKPANIFIEQRPNVPAVVKVLDFGVAKFAVEEHDDDYATLTQVGAIIGTPRYMSPEQCSGAAPLTPASDVYSLGIILYEMLAGSVPFSAETPIAVALKQVSEAPQPLRELAPSVPPQLEQIVLHALAKNPPARPQSANDLRHELIGVADQLGYEHAESARSPTLDQLRTAGTESPSGRLVIDLATLRQVQAAVGTRNADAAPPPQGSEPPQREIRRMQVSLDRPPAKGFPFVIAGIIVLLAVIGSGVLAARWWRGEKGGSVAVAEASPSPTATPTPTPTPASPPVVRRSPPKSPPKKESKLKSIWNKTKRILLP